MALSKTIKDNWCEMARPQGDFYDPVYNSVPALAALRESLGWHNPHFGILQADGLVLYKCRPSFNGFLVEETYTTYSTLEEWVAALGADVNDLVFGVDRTGTRYWDHRIQAMGLITEPAYMRVVDIVHALNNPQGG